MESVHWLDLTIVGSLLGGLLVGALLGLVRQVIWVVTYLLAVQSATFFHASVADKLRPHMPNQSPGLVSVAGYAIAFVVSFAVLCISVFLIKSIFRSLRTLDKAGVVAGLKPIDRLLGAGVGLAFVALLLGTALLGSALLANEELEGRLAGSRLRPYALKTMEGVIAAIPAERKEEIVQALERLKEAGVQAAGELAGQASPEVVEQLDRMTESLKKSGYSLEALKQLQGATDEETLKKLQAAANAPPPPAETN